MLQEKKVGAMSASRQPIERSTNDDEERVRRMRQRALNQGAIDLLDSWDSATPEDIEEQRRIWELLRVALDADRLSDRKLFE